MLDPYGSLRKKEKEKQNNSAAFSPMESLTNLFRSNNSMPPAANLQSPLNSPLQSPHNSYNQYAQQLGLSGGPPPMSPKLATSPQSSVNNFGSLGSLSSKRGDFIVFSEFSEQKGPVHLNVVPDMPLYEGFDLSTYVVKIMSIDFQNKTNDLRTYAKDAQMFFTLTSHLDGCELYAYVHHFSLFDIHARGYVRPLVLSYLTKDPHKVMKSFDKFLAKFARITNFLKSKNHLHFEMEFRQRMRDLDYTIECYRNDQSISEKERDTYIELINDAKAEMKSIEMLFDQEKKSREPIASDSGSNLGLDEENDSENDRDGSFRQQPRQHASGHGNVNSNGNGHRHGHYCNHGNGHYFNGGAKFKRGTLPHSLESTFGTINCNENLVLSGEPKVINSLQKTAYLDRALRTITELCTPEVTESFLRKLEKCYNYFSKSSLQMEFDKIDSQPLTPESTLLTIGQTSILNYYFNEDEGKQQSYTKSQKKDIKGKPHRKTNGGTMSSYSGSDLSSYLSVGSMNDQFGEFSLSLDDNYLKTLSNLSQLAQQNQQQQQISNSLLPGNLQTSLTSLNSSTLLPLPSSDYVSQPQIQQQNQQQNQQQQQQNNNDIKFETFSNYMWGTNKPFYGNGLLKLVHRYPWMKHAIYSLLKGRTVFVIGMQEKKTQILQMVYALAIFVVGYSRANKRETISLWHTDPLKLADLSWLKLAGIPRTTEKSKLPTNVNLYVSKIDLDTEEYSGPVYNVNNGIVDEILGLKKPWSDNESLYISYIQSMFFEIAIKSFIHYHVCCVVQPQPLRADHPLLSSSVLLKQQQQQQQQPHHQQLYHSTSDLPALSMTPPDSALQQSLYKSTSAFSRKKPAVVPITTRSLSESHLKEHHIQQSQQQQVQQQLQIQHLQSSLIPSVSGSPSEPQSVLSQSSSSTISNNSSSVTTNSNAIQQPMINDSNTSPSTITNSPSQSATTTNMSTSLNLSSKYSSARYTEAKTLFKRWELHPQDQIIIESLSDIIKEQQYFEIYSSKGQEMLPSIKLDFSPCVLVDRRGKERKIE